MKKTWRRLFGKKPTPKVPTFTISARVIRADGTVEELGVISKGTVEQWKVRT